MRLTPVQYVIHVLGTATALAEVVGVSLQAVSQRHQAGGSIPTHWMIPLLEYAAARNIDIVADDLVFGRTVGADAVLIP